MPAIRGGVEYDVVRPAFDSAFEYRFQRFVARVAVVEGEIVAIEDRAPIRFPQEGKQSRQGGNVLAVNFHQRDDARVFGDDVAMDGLDQGAFAAAPGAPQQRIVGRQTFGETHRVFVERVALLVDALQQIQIEAVDVRHGFEMFAFRVPHEGVRRAKVGARRRRRGESLQAVRDPAEQFLDVLFRHENLDLALFCGAEPNHMHGSGQIGIA